MPARLEARKVKNDRDVGIHEARRKRQGQMKYHELKLGTIPFY